MGSMRHDRRPSVGMGGRSSHTTLDRWRMAQQNFVSAISTFSVPSLNVIYTTGFKQSLVPFQIVIVAMSFWNIANDQIASV